jgi:acyl carrier protein
MASASDDGAFYRDAPQQRWRKVDAADKMARPFYRIFRMSAVPALTADELIMAQHLVQALSLDDVDARTIAPDAALFGSHATGLGLDSIDALEIALMIQQKYGVELRSEDEQARAAFVSLRNLTNYVLERRKN